MKHVKMYDQFGERLRFEPEEFCELTESCDLAEIKDFGFNHDVDFIVYSSTRLAEVIHLVRISVFGAQYYIESREDRFYELLDDARGVDISRNPAIA